MPQRHLRTRSRKRLKMTSPGKKNLTHYKTKKESLPSCAICGQIIKGTQFLTTAEKRKLSRSKRRIQRLYGGNLCHNCLKTTLKQAARTDKA